MRFWVATTTTVTTEKKLARVYLNGTGMDFLPDAGVLSRLWVSFALVFALRTS